MDSKIVQVALNGLENILRLGELEAKRGGGINPYCALIEEAYGKYTLSTKIRGVTVFLLHFRRFISTQVAWKFYLAGTKKNSISLVDMDIY